MTRSQDHIITPTMASYRSTQVLARATRSLVTRPVVRWASSTPANSAAATESKGKPKPIDDSTSALDCAWWCRRRLKGC